MKAAPPSLKAQALALLARREHSRAELRTKLLAHGRKLATWRVQAQAAADEKALAADAVMPASASLAEAFGLGAFADAASVDEAGEDASPRRRPSRPARPPSRLDEEAEASLGTEVDEVLDWLQTQRYQSDERFIESRVNARAQRMGTQRIRLELAQHGVTLDPDTAQQLRQTELERARELWRKRFGTPPQDLAEKARQMRFLAARGFAGDVVRRVVGGRDDD